MADDAIVQGLVDQVVTQLADVLTMTTGGAVRALPAVGHSPVDWQLDVTLGGRADAALVFGVSDAAARQLSAAVIGSADGLTDADLADTLRELVSQATAAVVNGDAAGDVRIDVGTPRHESCAPPGTAWHHDLVMTGDDPPRLVVWNPNPVAQTVPLAAAPAQTARPVSAAPQVAPAADGPAPRNLEVVLDLELPIMVRFGETRLTLDTLARLGPGSMIDLERLPDDPVDLLVNGRLIARGEVVVVSGSYGVRVSEVVSAADRLKSLGG